MRRAVLAMGGWVVVFATLCGGHVLFHYFIMSCLVWYFHFTASLKFWKMEIVSPLLKSYIHIYIFFYLELQYRSLKYTQYKHFT